MSPTEPDPSLATDRTALAWQRMAVASAAVAAVVVRQGIVHGLLGVALALAVVLLVAAAVQLRFASRLTAVLHAPQIAALTALILFVAAGAAVLAVAG
jgi:uncharacterized membrane protein